MTVVCRFQSCYYYDRGFCSNPLTAINESGGCDLLYKKDGKPRNNIEQGPRMKIVIEEGSHEVR